MITRRTPWAAVLVAAFTCGCGSNEFSTGVVKATMEGNPVTLEAEQVMLNAKQLECGSREGLWDPPRQIVTDRQTGRLTDKGRALKFDDDVTVGEAGNKQPYLQVRGQFPLRVTEIVSITDGPAADIKLVRAKVAVTIQHDCFPTPLPLMGVRQGKFTQDTDPVFQFRVSNNVWNLERVVH